MATSWTQTDLNALEAAIAQGVRVVQYGERRVEYHSLREMLDLRAAMSDAVARQGGTAPDRFSYASFSKGSDSVVQEDE